MLKQNKYLKLLMKVASHYRFAATINDSFMGIKAPGKRFNQEGVTIFTIKDDKIYYSWGTYNRKTLLDQLQEED